MSDELLKRAVEENERRVQELGGNLQQLDKRLQRIEWGTWVVITVAAIFGVSGAYGYKLLMTATEKINTVTEKVNKVQTDVGALEKRAAAAADAAVSKIDEAASRRLQEITSKNFKATASQLTQDEQFVERMRAKLRDPNVVRGLECKTVASNGAGTQRTLARCPQGWFLTGGGMRSRTPGVGLNLESLSPDEDEAGVWTCDNIGNEPYLCYAICCHATDT